MKQLINQPGYPQQSVLDLAWRWFDPDYRKEAREANKAKKEAKKKELEKKEAKKKGAKNEAKKRHKVDESESDESESDESEGGEKPAKRRKVEDKKGLCKCHAATACTNCICVTGKRACLQDCKCNLSSNTKCMNKYNSQ